MQPIVREGAEDEDLDGLVTLSLDTFVWYTVGDEDAFFCWMYKIPGYLTCRGQGTVVRFWFRTDQVTEVTAGELTAAFLRYFPRELGQLRKLAPCLSIDGEPWWNEHVFGPGGDSGLNATDPISLRVGAAPAGDELAQEGYSGRVPFPREQAREIADEAVRVTQAFGRLDRLVSELAEGAAKVKLRRALGDVYRVLMADVIGVVEDAHPAVRARASSRETPTDS